MNIYERGLNNLKEADVPTISNWIRERAKTNSATPLDTSYTAARMDSASLIPALHKESDDSSKQKLEEALNLLLRESTSQLNFVVLSEIIHTIGRIEYHFPYQVLFEFILEHASPKDDYTLDAKSEALALLQGHIKNSDEIYQFYTEWFWSDPITIGVEHAFQLFAGLVERDPVNYPQLLIRLNKINGSIPGENRFKTHWIWAVIVDNCTEDILQNGLRQLPQELSDQLHTLRQQDPDLYSCESDTE